MFAFAGKDSEEMGLLCTQYSLRHKAERSYTFDSIPGRAEPDIQMEDTLQPVLINVDCVVMDATKLESIYGWLHNAGKGVLIDERHPDRYRTAVVCGKITPTQINDEIVELSIPFLCSALVYNVDNPVETLTASGTVVTNNGTIYCEPVYTLYVGWASSLTDLTINMQVANASGTSSFSFTVNEQTRSQPIVLDAAKQLIHTIGTRESLMSLSANRIPFLDVGENTITWDSSYLQRVDVKKNERYI